MNNRRIRRAYILDRLLRPFGMIAVLSGDRARLVLGRKIVTEWPVEFNNLPVLYSDMTTISVSLDKLEGAEWTTGT